MFGTPEKEPVGVNNVIRDIGAAILEQDKSNEYFALESNYLHFPIKSITDVKMNEGVWEGKRKGLLAEIYGIDVIYSFFNPIHEIRCESKKIFMVHDLIPLIHPEWHSAYDFFNGPIRQSCEVADKIVAVSEATKRDIVSCYNIAPEKVRVIYHGVSKTLDFENANQDVCKQYELYDGYILSVCTLEPRKNLRGLIEAFTQFRESNKNSRTKLVLTGKAGWDTEFRNYVESLGSIKRDIILTGFVSDYTLAGLYKYATAVAYVSFYEGFGLPVLEAMAAGKAVISSNTSSMPEVGGDAVIYCDPYKIESIAEALEKVVKNEKLRKEYEIKAKKQAQKFSYEFSAKENIELLKELI